MGDVQLKRAVLGTCQFERKQSDATIASSPKCAPLQPTAQTARHFAFITRIAIAPLGHTNGDYKPEQTPACPSVATVSFLFFFFFFFFLIFNSFFSQSLLIKPQLPE